MGYFQYSMYRVTEYKEHTATVANLCRRFRLASTKKKNTIGFTIFTVSSD